MNALNKLSIKKLTFSTTRDKAAGLGLLVSRILFGLTLFHYHGLEKITDFNFRQSHFRDPLGLGMHFTFFYAMLSDSICSLLIACGILTRPAAVILFVNVLVAFVFVYPWEQRLLIYVAYSALIVFSGAGRYSVDSLFLIRANDA